MTDPTTTLARVRVGQWVRDPQDTAYHRVAAVRRDGPDVVLVDDDGHAIARGGARGRVDVADANPIVRHPAAGWWPGRDDDR
jgi:hypothetical protein